jgi:hypothetical protein
VQRSLDDLRINPSHAHCGDSFSCINCPKISQITVLTTVQCDCLYASTICLTGNMAFNTPHTLDDARRSLASSPFGGQTTGPSQASPQSRSIDRTETQSLNLPPIAEWYDARRDAAPDARAAMRFKTSVGRSEATTETTKGSLPTHQSTGMLMHPEGFNNAIAGHSSLSQQSYPNLTSEYGSSKLFELPDRSAMARRDSSVACWTAMSPEQRMRDDDPTRLSYMPTRPPIQESIMNSERNGDYTRYAVAAHDTAGSYYPEDRRIKREHAHGHEAFGPISQASHMQPTHEVSAHAESNPTILTYLPGLLPAAAGRKNRGYIGVEVINGQKFHIYEGGLCLPYEVNGERVNEWWGLTKANIPRKRLATACDRCREKKVRCEPGVEGCLQCQRAHTTCLR